jgi:hypothetical protein
MNDALLPLDGLHEPIANVRIRRQHVERVSDDHLRPQLADLHHELTEVARRLDLVADDLQHLPAEPFSVVAALFLRVIQPSIVIATQVYDDAHLCHRAIP